MLLTVRNMAMVGVDCSSLYRRTRGLNRLLGARVGRHLATLINHGLYKQEAFSGGISTASHCSSEISRLIVSKLKFEKHVQEIIPRAKFG